MVPFSITIEEAAALHPSLASTLLARGHHRRPADLLLLQKIY
jgi:hypothetical protein